MDRRTLLEKFFHLFGDENREVHLFFAPGRVNLIGEHTDYNGGYVFPCALTMGLYGVARKRKDTKLRFYSMNQPEAGMVLSDLEELVPKSGNDWTQYPKGVLWAFRKKGFALRQGLDMLVWGDLPEGAGVSSSAALEVLTGVILRGLNDFSLSGIELAQLGQYAENQFIGCQCGIMDPFASAMGKQKQGIFLDTYSLAYEYAPVDLPDKAWVLVDSRVKHSLADSAYNERRSQCSRALADLQKQVDAATLCKLTVEQFEKYRECISDLVCRKRAKHVVYEQQRTRLAYEALQRQEGEVFGRLMNASHRSLRDDFAVSCPEMDFLVAQAQTMESVAGARMTGGGFGGCTVNLVDREAVEDFQKRLGEAYRKQYGIQAKFYEIQAGDGAGEV